MLLEFLCNVRGTSCVCVCFRLVVYQCTAALVSPRGSLVISDLWWTQRATNARQTGRCLVPSSLSRAPQSGKLGRAHVKTNVLQVRQLCTALGVALEGKRWPPTNAIFEQCRSDQGLARNTFLDTAQARTLSANGIGKVLWALATMHWHAGCVFGLYHVLESA